MTNNLFWIFVSAAIVTNFVLVYFLGLCPVIGVTSRSATGLRLGLATTFVMVLASLAAWVLNTWVLPSAPYLRVISFVVAIASIVQIVELFVKKTSPVLYRDLGIFLPLIASNSQVLGNGTFLGFHVMPKSYEPWVVMMLPPGGFFMIGFLLLASNWRELRARARHVAAPAAPRREPSETREPEAIAV